MLFRCAATDVHLLRKGVDTWPVYVYEASVLDSRSNKTDLHGGSTDVLGNISGTAGIYSLAMLCVRTVPHVSTLGVAFPVRQAGVGQVWAG
jgi:hypothetical protein